MSQPHNPIGVFDSGVGGISVLRHLIRVMPAERYLYYGDIANAPYGGKTTQQVRELTLEAAEYLFSQGVKALVIACNTATAAAITAVREKYPHKIVVGIEPAIKLAADRGGGKVGIMATEVTLREEKLANLVERFPVVESVPIHTPDLVSLIESGASREDLIHYLTPILSPYAGQLDAVVLGCTHYPFASEAIRFVLGERTCLLDGGDGTAQQTRRLLAQAELLSDGPGGVQIENSADDPAFNGRAQDLLKISHEF